ncbi:MAG: tRNA lysidine(34) synthetase TilS, partial [Lachnospiraceae bacterium]|nr:tRNA lysidine(34) synthetase TilS [Lachnospiraceae bacterium]
KWFNYDKIVSNVQIRNRRAGDYLTINRDGGKKKLKSYMIDEKIPAHMRDKIPVIADGSHVMWVFGGRMSEGYKVTAGTKRILKITGKEKEEDVRQDSGINSGRGNQ